MQKMEKPHGEEGVGVSVGKMREHRLRTVGSNLPVLPAGHPGELCGSNWAGALGRLGESRFEQGGMRNPHGAAAAPRSWLCVNHGSVWVWDLPPHPAPPSAAKRVYYSGCRCQVSSAPP